MVAFFLYIDGVGTIIDNCINIGTDLKLDSVGQVVFLLFTQIVACIGSLVFGRLSQTYKTTTLLYVCIAGYFAVCLYALTLHDLIGFGIMAFGVGCFQGSLQALSRSYFSKIIPPENSGEYFESMIFLQRSFIFRLACHSVSKACRRHDKCGSCNYGDILCSGICIFKACRQI